MANMCQLPSERHHVANERPFQGFKRSNLNCNDNCLRVKDSNYICFTYLSTTGAFWTNDRFKLLKQTGHNLQLEKLIVFISPSWFLSSLLSSYVVTQVLFRL